MVDDINQTIIQIRSLKSVLITLEESNQSFDIDVKKQYKDVFYQNITLLYLKLNALTCDSKHLDTAYQFTRLFSERNDQLGLNSKRLQEFVLMKLNL